MQLRCLHLNSYTMPILKKQTNHSKPFIMEVDASEMGVWVFSQEKSPSSIKWPSFQGSCPSLSKTITLGTELLAVKLALEEWCHCLEGALHTFTIYMYMKSAKWFNSCQTCWVLSFTCFEFTFSYHPGSKNNTADCGGRGVFKTLFFKWKAELEKWAVRKLMKENKESPLASTGERAMPRYVLWNVFQPMGTPAAAPLAITAMPCITLSMMWLQDDLC